MTSLSSSYDVSQVTALCLGTGRFLRSVLVPVLVQAGDNTHVALIQPRGTSFCDFMHNQAAAYPVETVQEDGSISTQSIPLLGGSYSFGTASMKQEFLSQTLPQMKRGISIVGVGVTEAGLSSSETPAMQHLFDILCALHQHQPEQSVVVIDMDNVPNNGSTIQEHIFQLLLVLSASSSDDTSSYSSEATTATALLTTYLHEKVEFVNTMVDRITAAHPDNSHIPRCEPLPRKALVIGDYQGTLANNLWKTTTTLPPGVLLRQTPEELQQDIALKLQIANGTHTAIAHALALSKHTQTTTLSESNAQALLWRDYLDVLVQHQIIVAAACPIEAKMVWEDWRRRLLHPHFGLSTFFITQNGTSKGGIRWGPTVKTLLEDADSHIQVSFAIAYATLLRWLTPASIILSSPVQSGDIIYRGWFVGVDPTTNSGTTTNSVKYADGLSYNLEAGWYDFKCPLPELIAHMTDLLHPTGSSQIQIPQPRECRDMIRYYLTHEQGGNLKEADGSSSEDFDFLVDAIAVYYARFIAGDLIEDVLQELKDSSSWTLSCRDLVKTVSPVSSTTRLPNVLHYRPNHLLPDASKLLTLPLSSAAAVADIVTAEVQSVVAIDLHTHLLPPSHGPLCLWGIDELLTYHYLVAEYFMTAPPSMTPDDFYAIPTKQDQADLIWKALFMDRSPISEACRGVLTTLSRLGLQDLVQQRDLAGIRAFYAKHYRDVPNGAQKFSEQVFAQAGIEYAIMTNIPFAKEEVKFWKPSPTSYSDRYRSALRVDPLLAGDRVTIESALQTSGYDLTLEGARQYLRDWCDTMQPEYMMASTPHDFVVREGTTLRRTGGINAEAMKEPGAFAAAMSTNDHVTTCDGAEDEAPSVIDETSDFLGEVLMKVCEERDLPIALKIGAHRAVNPQLRAAGDGVVAFCDGNMLSRLCTRFPKVRFLATFLSRTNQHEACVLANKFRNLHLYGCWWYCNNPSIIREITTMRVEMLGTAFTAQHSDARVLDQLLYKWPHSRAIIANVLVKEYQKLLESGWGLTRAEIRRDVRRLFRGSYEEFMKKSLI